MIIAIPYNPVKMAGFCGVKNETKVSLVRSFPTQTIPWLNKHFWLYYHSQTSISLFKSFHKFLTEYKSGLWLWCPFQYTDLLKHFFVDFYLCFGSLLRRKVNFSSSLADLLEWMVHGAIHESFYLDFSPSPSSREAGL